MGREVAIDASDLPAYANGQRYICNGGAERQTYSDPDASWGHRSAVSTRKGGGFYGYRIHAAVCAVTGLPFAWRVETARSHESMHVASLLDAVSAGGFVAERVAMDMGYDNNRVYAECAERGAAAIIPLRRGQKERNLRVPCKGDEWRSLYRRRSAVEREFGRLKHDYGLAFPRVRGIERVRLHADLIMLARLATALSCARAVPLARRSAATFPVTLMPCTGGSRCCFGWRASPGSSRCSCFCSVAVSGRLCKRPTPTFRRPEPKCRPYTTGLAHPARSSRRAGPPRRQTWIQALEGSSSVVSERHAVLEASRSMAPRAYSGKGRSASPVERYAITSPCQANGLSY
jgi:hypothetical protein